MKLGGESVDNNTFLDKLHFLNHFQQSFLYRFILIILIILTISMISLGGATRLTGSGLSMVQWNLIMGIFPPFSEIEWQDKFKEYQKFPEYQILNFTMTVDEFKRIFYFEYFHRLLGRVIGAITFILFFLALIKSRYIKIKFHTFLLFVLVSFQGLVGWYMVQSGLVDVPRVSHYRLFVHFFLAILYLSWLWYLLIEPIPQLKVLVPRFFHVLINLTMVVFIIQIGFGVLLAGLDGGLVSHSYPHMFGRLIPENLITFPGNIINKFFDNPVFINFFHRHWGILTAFLLGVVGIAGRIIISSKGVFKGIQYISIILIVLAVIQPLAGIITLILEVPVGWGILHQFLAVLIWSFLLLLKLLTIKQS